MKQKFSEAGPQMKPGDIFKPDDAKWGSFELYKDGDNMLSFKSTVIGRVSLSPGHFNLEGEIIRAEPEVLTADEMARKMLVDSIHTTQEYGEAMDLNGQIKEWKRLKPFIDTVEKYRCGSNRASADDLYRALENLTPPWEPEK